MARCTFGSPVRRRPERRPRARGQKRRPGGGLMEQLAWGGGTPACLRWSGNTHPHPLLHPHGSDCARRRDTGWLVPGCELLTGATGEVWGGRRGPSVADSDVNRLGTFDRSGRPEEHLADGFRVHTCVCRRVVLALFCVFQHCCRISLLAICVIWVAWPHQLRAGSSKQMRDHALSCR